MDVQAISDEIVKVLKDAPEKINEIIADPEAEIKKIVGDGEFDVSEVLAAVTEKAKEAGVDLSKIDLSKLDLSKLDLSKFDLSKVQDLAKEAGVDISEFASKIDLKGIESAAENFLGGIFGKKDE